jgi:predicted O-methyltransferase YrrM
MSNETLPLTDDLYAYLKEKGIRESAALAALREETASLPMSMMQIAPEQGQFMAMLIRLTGARLCLEVGTFTGYSALACAEALPTNGKLIALDISDEWTAIGRRHWAAAGLADRIDLRLGPAADSLKALLDEGRAGSFDFMFIDADKTGYLNYYELGLQLLRPGGLVAVDNVLWSGAVAAPGPGDEDTEALRRFNDALADDKRIDLVMVPIGDGLSLARKRIGAESLAQGKI